MLRQTPRVILRTPRPGRFGDDEILVLEMGLGGAKCEHPARFDVGRLAPFSCGPLSTDGEVRHSLLLPTKTGVIYQSGLLFTNVSKTAHDLLLGLLVHEAKEQVIEWESNLEGVAPAMPMRRAPRRSAVVSRFIVLQHTGSGWEQRISTDPNQPIDGVTVTGDTPEEEIAVLKKTYAGADSTMRELMRRVAMVAILEQMGGRTATE